MAAPELRLSVGLDLALLRQQIATISTQLGGQPLNVAIKLDRTKIASEYRLLQRYFGNKTFRVSVETNLKKELEYADKLKIALANLSAQQTKNLASQAATGKKGGFINEAQFASFLNRLTKEPLQAVRKGMEKAGVQMQSAGKSTVAELRQSIISGLPQVTEDIARGLADGLDPKMKENGRKGAGLFINAYKNAAGIASPSKVFKQIGEFSADGLEIGFLNGLKGFGAKALVEIKKIAALMRLELASVGDVRIGAGTGTARTGGRGGRQYLSPVGPLPQGSREPWAWNRGSFRYEPRMAQPGEERGLGVSPMRSRFPFAPEPPVMGTTTTASMYGVSRPALPPAGAATETRQAALALRELEARARSAARAATVFAEDAASAARRSAMQAVSGQVPLGRGGFPQLPAGGFPSDKPFGPVQGPAAPPPMSIAGGELAKALRDSDRYLRQARVPLAGAIEELAGEFGQATKQVLLYGAAYKGLAFIMDLPSQALDAAATLQSLRNQLQAITGSAAETERSFAFLDSLAERFAVPLASIREGFGRMYASMQPAGFSGEEIQGLFSGISKAAATFGMSADQVDRVSYALSQMASKGQIMAEELRGQLGDVLPGALALFAEAAQMSIPEFSKAMEDGAFKGEAMRQVLNNVGILLDQKFSAGATGAAKTLRGALNTMQNSLLKLYESFEPLVNIVAQQAFPLISEAVTGATQAVQAFAAAVQGNTGPASALSGQALAIYTAFQQIAEIGRALGDVIMSLAPTFADLGRFILFALEQTARFINTPVGGFLANFAAKVALVTAALQLMAKAGILAAVRGLVLLATQTQATIAKLRLLIVTSAAAKFALAGIVVAAVLTGFEVLANSIDKVNQKLAESAARARRTRDELMDMALAGNTASITERMTTAEERAGSFRQSKETLERLGRDRTSRVSEEEFARLQRSGLASGLTRLPTGEILSTGGQLTANIQAATREWNEALAESGNAQEALKTAVQVAGRNQRQALAPIDLQPSGDPGKAARDADKQAGAYLDAVERREEALANARTQLEESLVDIRKRAVEQVAAIERQYADRRLQIERDIAKTRRGLAFEAARQQQESGAALRILGGESSEAIKTERELAQAMQQYTEEKIAREEKAQDEQIRKARELEDFRVGIARAINEANERYAKQIGEIQRNYAKAVAKIVSEGAGQAAKKLEAAGKVTALLLRQATAADVLSGAGQALGAGQAVVTVPSSPGEKFGYGSKTFDFQQFKDAASRSVSPVREAGLELASVTDQLFKAQSDLRATLGARPADASVSVKAVDTSDLDASIKQYQQNLIDLQGIVSNTADALSYLETIQATFVRQQANFSGTFVPDLQNLRKENSLLERQLELRQSGLSISKAEEQAESDLLVEKFEVNISNLIAQAKQFNAIPGVEGRLDKLIEDFEKEKKDAVSLFQSATTAAQQRRELLLAGLEEENLKDKIFLAGIIDPKLQLSESLKQQGLQGPELERRLKLELQLQETEKFAQRTKDLAASIGDAFGNAFRSIVTGTSSVQEALAGMFKSIADSFANMVGEVISQWMRTQILEGFQSIFSAFTGGLGGSLGGSALSGAVSAAGNMGSFGFNPSAMTDDLSFPVVASANGNVLQGGFQAFANGGIVKGPTLGLVGEGRYNEAVVPLPDGRKIPVDLGGSSGGDIATSIVVNVSNGQSSSETSGTQGNQLARELEGAVKQVILKETRPGGIIFSQR